MIPRAWMVTSVLALLVGACGDRTTELATDPAPPQARDAASDGTRTTDATSPIVDTGPPPPAGDCGGHACGCSNGLDDDGDQLVDGFDPECTGPFDDDESSFGTGGIEPTEGCLDCYFDGNATSDDDQCAYPSACSFSEQPSPVDVPDAGGACGGCEVSGQCVQACRALTPNGCDCFGCCEVATPDGALVAVRAVEGCSVAAVQDENACPRCTPHNSCRNRCGRCELCPGRTAADLPDNCKLDAGAQDEPNYVCDDGEVVCSDSRPCDPDHYCQSGCCLIRVL
jgi:hypothetical protein